MKIKVKLRNFFPSREGVAQSTGNKWVMTDVEVAFSEQLYNGDTMEHTLCVAVPHYIDEQKARTWIERGTEFEMFIRFGTSTYSGRCYNNVRGNLPKELMREEREAATAPSPFPPHREGEITTAAPHRPVATSPKGEEVITPF